MNVVNKSGIIGYCEKRQILSQYLKACSYIELGFYDTVKLKLLHPKEYGIYQFRITGKFRGLAIKEDENLIVFEISDHQ